MSDQIRPTNNDSAPEYWQSLEQYYNDPSIAEAKSHEFGKGVTDDFDPEKNLSGLSRRKFLALLGTSAAVVAAGCSDYRDKGEIVPYNQKPEDITLGVANHYASTCTSCGLGCGILIKTREGRPIKVDGNPDHPVNKGKICSIGQGSIINLYDPARLKEPVRNADGTSRTVTWKEADESIMLNLLTVSGELAIITEPVTSPAKAKLLQDFSAKYPATRIYSYRQFDDNTASKAWSASYGITSRPVVRWDKADVILTLEADILGTDGNRVEQMRLFAERRSVSDAKKFNRLYAVEGNMSVTGMNADYRLRLRTDKQYDFVMALINELVTRKGVSAPETLRSKASGFSLQEVAKSAGMDTITLTALVNDLAANRGKGIVYAGTAQPGHVHLAVNALNEILGNTTVYAADEAPALYELNDASEDIFALVSKMNAGKVGMIVHLDVNPVYTLPQSVGYANALKKVKTSVTITEFETETSLLSGWVLPKNHTFESWGDTHTRATIYSLQQPVIDPLYTTRQAEAVLLHWINGGEFNPIAYHAYLKGFWETTIFPLVNPGVSFDRFWTGSLHDGVVVTAAKPAINYTFKPESLASLPGKAAVSGMALVVKESYHLGDGKYAGNGWLQELQHPVSKVTWDNYAAISVNTSKKLGVKTEDFIEVKNGSLTLTLPALIQPGLADDTIVIETGYGRTISNVVTRNVGFNANILLSTKGVSPFLYTGVSATKASGSYALASTQDHYIYDDELIKDQAHKREIVREGTLLMFNKDPEFLKKGKMQELKQEMDEKYQIYTPHKYEGNKWAMAIDLNKCTGCGDCTIACNIENNIPVVGKDQVIDNREMAWMRIDRYYSGEPDDPKASFQPMLCQHCDQAPCENVCPVVATTHSSDGLNQMVYNRCVGTRYCSNNCPYKVRRFNFFDFRDHFAKGVYADSTIQLMNNPEVTVRSRGVMEKCTFCVHKIAEARSIANNENRPIRDGEVVSACEAACSASAITFGDANDPESRVAKLREHSLGYVVLQEFNIKPNVTYIAKLRNTHSENA